VTGTTETTVENKDDGSVITVETNMRGDGFVASTTTTTVNEDNTKVVEEKTIGTTEKGASLVQNTTTNYDAEGTVTSITENYEVESIGNNTNATISISKDGDGNITDANVEIDKTGVTKGKGVQATITNTVMSQVGTILGDASDSANITMTVKDESGEKQYSVTVNSSELVPNNTLYIYKQDADGNYVMVNAKEYTTDDNGQLKLNIQSKNDFVMLNESEAAAATKAILNTVKPAKTTASVKQSKSTTMKLSSKLNTANVKSITYKTSKKSVATVNKNGKISAKSTGKTTISAIVTLKNGTKKTVKMTITVK
jgi:hypothetical protein